MVVLIFSLIFSIGSNNYIENGWKGIKPLQTSKEKVEKILGKGRLSEFNDYVIYSNKEVGIRMDYTITPCTQNNYNRGNYQVKPNTVRRYWVLIKGKNFPLSKLKYRSERYKRLYDVHEPQLAHYANIKDGVLINVVIDNGIEYVESIEFHPSEKDENSLKCKTL